MHRISLSPGNLKRSWLHSCSKMIASSFTSHCLAFCLLIVAHNGADIEGRQPFEAAWWFMRQNFIIKKSPRVVLLFNTWKNIRCTLETCPTNCKCSLYIWVAWLVPWFVHSWQLLDSKGFTSFNYEEAPATMPATYLNKNIALSAQLGGWMRPQSCRQNPYYRMARCKVLRSSVVLMH